MIYILHDNPDWLSGLRTSLIHQNIKYTEWNFRDPSNILNQIEIDKAPPQGVFYNRVSASSHTRGARYSLEQARMVIVWLEKWGRRVINGSHTLDIESSKFVQYLYLNDHDIGVPQSRYATNVNQLSQLTDSFLNDGKKCIIKDNRGGSGISVELIENSKNKQEYIKNYIEPIDGVSVIQEYIESPNPYITRLEFINGRFIYAVKVNTSQGFRLCPADKCNLDKSQKRFEILKHFPHRHLIEKCETLIKNKQIDVCGMECIQDKDGHLYIYDINCNTNYNSKAEKDYGQEGLATRLLIELFQSK